MDNRHYICDENMQPVQVDDWLTWAKWYETADRHVALTEIGDAKVSTVFLSLNHAFHDGPPLLYETLVFGGELDGEMEGRTPAAKGITRTAPNVRGLLRLRYGGAGSSNNSLSAASVASSAACCAANASMRC
jgi:hypothetical protein